jgi:hypothetical protein
MIKDKLIDKQTYMIKAFSITRLIQDYKDNFSFYTCSNIMGGAVI